MKVALAVLLVGCGSEASRSSPPADAAAVVRPVVAPAPVTVDAGAPPARPDLLAQAARDYDRGDFPAAHADALAAIAAGAGTDARVLRILVSVDCMDHDVGEARRYWKQLGEADRKDIATRCARFGVTLR